MDGPAGAGFRGGGKAAPGKRDAVAGPTQPAGGAAGAGDQPGSIDKAPQRQCGSADAGLWNPVPVAAQP